MKPTRVYLLPLLVLLFAKIYKMQLETKQFLRFFQLTLYLLKITVELF